MKILKKKEKSSTKHFYRIYRTQDEVKVEELSIEKETEKQYVFKNEDEETFKVNKIQMNYVSHTTNTLYTDDLKRGLEKMKEFFSENVERYTILADHQKNYLAQVKKFLGEKNE